MAFYASYNRADTNSELQAEMEQHRRFGELLKQVDAAASSISVQLGILNRARTYRAKDATEAIRMQAQALRARDGVVETYRQLGLLFQEALDFDDKLAIEKQ